MEECERVQRKLLPAESASFKQLSGGAKECLHSHFIGQELVICPHLAAKDDGKYIIPVCTVIANKIRVLLLRRGAWILFSDGHSLPQIQCVVGFQMRGHRPTFRRLEKDDKRK